MGQSRRSSGSGTWVTVSSGREGSVRSLIAVLGNLHLNVIAREWSEEVRKVVEPFVYEITGESNALTVMKRFDPLLL